MPGLLLVARCFNLITNVVLPAKLAIFPGSQVNLAISRSSANIRSSSFVLNRPSEECTATEASHGAIMNVFGGGLIANLELKNCHKNISY